VILFTLGRPTASSTSSSAANVKASPARDPQRAALRAPDAAENSLFFCKLFALPCFEMSGIDYEPLWLSRLTGNVRKNEKTHPAKRTFTVSDKRSL
jgi:hypothetical protein